MYKSAEDYSSQIIDYIAETQEKKYDKTIIKYDVDRLVAEIWEDAQETANADQIEDLRLEMKELREEKLHLENRVEELEDLLSDIRRLSNYD